MRRHRHHRPFLALLVLLAAFLGAAACASSQNEADRTTESIDAGAEHTVRSIDAEAQRTLEQMGSELGQFGEEAKKRVQDGSKEVRESAVSAAVAFAVPGEFKRRGVDVEGFPDCRTTSPAIGNFHVECTAKTPAGEDVRVVGDDPGDGPSTFVGTVNGKETFRQECIGVC